MSDAGGDDFDAGGGGYEENNDNGGEVAEGEEGVDTYTEVEHESFGERLGNACCGVVIGVILFFVGIAVLIWNEGDAVRSYNAINDASDNVKSLPTVDVVDPAFNGELVHLFGTAEAGSNVSDPLFNLYYEGSLFLTRSVEMYQWKETSRSSSKKNAGGSKTTTTTYDYSKEWNSQLVSSSSFKRPEGHQNPTVMPFESYQSEAMPITLGAFTLPQSVTAKFSGWTEYTQDFLFDVDNIPNSTLELTTLPVSVYDEQGYYFGNDRLSPQVGDIRVRFSQVPSVTITIIAEQISNTLTSYTASNGKKLLYVERGILSSTEVLENAEREIETRTWILRLVGFILMWIGLQLVVMPLSVFADIIPCLGDCVGGLTCIISGVVAGVISVLVIALFWLFFRPFIAIPFLLGLCGITYFFYWKKKQRDEEKGGDDDDSIARINTQDDFGDALSPKKEEDPEINYNASPY